MAIGHSSTMTANKSQLAWGILATGHIAHVFARGVAKSRTGKIVAVGSRKQATADAFAKEFDIPRAYDSYEKVLADPEVQAVYISMHHPMHAEWCIKAAQAKKHILCEKPLTVNYADAVKVVAEARKQKVFLMEAFMYRCHPQTTKLVEIIRSGTIGKVQLIRAAFGYKADFNPEARSFKNSLGGGAILDIGCYTISISRLIAGASMGLPFVDPIELTAMGELHPQTKTDLYTIASVRFPEGILAEIATSVILDHEWEVLILGSSGSIRVPSPYLMAREGGESKILFWRNGAPEWETVVLNTKDYLYGLEADAVADALAQGKLESPFITLDDTLGNMKAMDTWRKEIGLIYDFEK